MHSYCDIVSEMGGKAKAADLGAQLRTAFHESGLTRYALANEAELPYATVFHFIAGRNISLDSASQIARVLGMELRRVKRQEK